MEPWASHSMAVLSHDSAFVVGGLPDRSVRNRANRENVPIILTRAHWNRCFTVLEGMDSACIGIPRYGHHPAEPAMNLESNSHFASLGNAIFAGRGW